MAYFDPQLNVLKPELYTWDDTNDSSANWANASTWEDWLGSYSATAGVPDLVFTTEIIDFGRLTHVNPLCTVVSSGTHNIKVLAAESIDSSSLLPGVPEITVTTSGQVLPGIYARYFQFRIEVFDGADSFIRSVTTDLNSEEQIEMVTGNSSTHGGTQAARIAPLSKSYSVITGLVGNAKADGSITPFVTTGNNTTQAVYTVHDFTDASTEDSSTEVGIADFTNNVTITNSGAAAVETNFQFQPSSIEFENTDKISFTAPSTGNTYTYEMYMNITQAPGGDPGFNHPDHFMVIPTSGNDILIRTGTTSGNLRLDISTDGGSNFTNGSTHSVGTWFHMAIVANGSQIKGYINGNEKVSVSSSATPSGTVEIGDLGSGGGGEWYLDEFRISDRVEYTGSFLPPGEHVVTGNTKVLINGLKVTVTSTVASEMQTVDAVVNLLVTGLPKMVSDANNNIVEQA